MNGVLYPVPSARSPSPLLYQSINTDRGNKDLIIVDAHEIDLSGRNAVPSAHIHRPKDPRYRPWQACWRR